MFPVPKIFMRGPKTKIEKKKKMFKDASLKPLAVGMERTPIHEQERAKSTQAFFHFWY